MAFSYSNGVITQTADNTDLSGLSGLTGVTVISYSNRYTVYALGTNRLDIEGNLTINPEENMFISNASTGTAPNMAVNVRNGATLTLGEKTTVGTANKYTTGTAFILAERGTLNNDGSLLVESGATLEAYGATIQMAGPARILAGATLTVEDLTLVNCRNNNCQFRIEAASAADVALVSITENGMTLNGKTSSDSCRLTTIGNDNPFNPDAFIFNFVRAQYQPAAGGYPPQVFLNFDNGNNIDSADFAYAGSGGSPNTQFDGDLVDFRNVARRLRYTNANNNGGFSQTTKVLNFNLVDQDFAGLNTISYYAIDVNNGSRIDFNGFDSTADLTYSGTNAGPSLEVIPVIEFMAGESSEIHIDDRTNNDTIEFKFVSYNTNITTASPNLIGLNTLNVDVVNVTDSNIVASEFVANAYTQINTSERFYDRAKSYLVSNFQGESLYVNRSGNEIDAGNYDVTIDATATPAFDITDNLITIKASTYTGDMTTTGVITLSNGAVFNGIRTDQNGTVYPPIDVTFTGLQTGSQLVVYVTGSTTEKFRTNSSGTSEQWTEVYTADINYDVTIQKAGFFPIRFTNLTASTIPITTSINQLIDRAYQTSSGLTYNTNANVNTTTKEFSVSVATTVQNYYSFWIEQWISNSALRNIKFPVSTFGGNSFSFDDGYEFTNSSLQYLSRDGFRYFDSGNVTARYAAILSQGVSTGLQAEYQQAQGGSITDAQDTGNVDQVIQIYGDSTHGNFDYTDYLVFKVQGNGFRQAEANIVSVFGTLEEQFYVTSLNTLAILNFTTGNLNVTGLSITDNSANPVSWDAGDETARDYSLTITDTNNNTGENILRWLNYNLSLDATFQGKDPFYFPEMVIDNGSSYETIRGILYGSTSNVLAGVRVIDGNGDPHRDFTRFQSDDGTYGVPVEIKTVSITGITTNSRLRIYNQTTTQETFNGVITGTSYTEEYTEGNNYSQGDLLSIRIAQQSGATAKLPYETQVIVGATGWSLLVSQEDDVIYNQIAIDGSAVTKFEADYQNNEIDIIVASDFTGIELYSSYVYFTTTEDGIRDFFKAFNPLDIANYENDVTVLDLYLNNNTSTNIKQIDNVRLFKSDGSYPVREPTTGGGGIDVNWRNTVYPVGLGDLENKVQNLVDAENADIFVTPTRFTKKIEGTETVILEKTYTTDGQGTESLTEVT